MKSKNKILVGCLALLLALGVGYALFSETVTIDGTATAKGELELTSSVIDDSQESGIVTNSNINIDGDIITADATFGAPGSSKSYIVEVKNTGTIPVVLKNVTDENGNVAGMLSNWYGKEVCNASKTSCMYSELAVDGNYASDYEDEPYMSPDYAPDEDVLFQSVLDPGESTYFYIDLMWGENSTSGETVSLSYAFKLNWQQITAN